MTEGVFSLFFAPDEVAEIRAIGCTRSNRAWDGFASGNGVVSGYFDKPEAFARCARLVDEATPTGVYFSLNPVAPELLARASNRLKAMRTKDATTRDKEIKCLRWLYVDLDPERFTGVSASKEELDKALSVAKQIVHYLEDENSWPRAVRAMSGNGYHLLYRVPDLPVADEHADLLHNCLRALDARFSTDAVKVDLSTFNPARICKLYGTMARKGDNVETRPWRKSMLLRRNDKPTVLADVGIASVEQLKALADQAPEEAKKSASSASGMDNNKKVGSAGSQRSKKSHNGDNSLGKLDLGQYLAHYGIEVYRIDKAKDGGDAFRLVECVFDPSHGPNEASICQSDSYPYLTYQCFHNSCNRKTWRDARAKISGTDKIARFYDGYNPHWRPPAAGGSEKRFANHDVVPTAGDPSPPPSASPATVGEAEVPSPAEIPMEEFFDVGDRGRAVFVPKYMATYFNELFGPIVHTDGVFWRYEAGVWREFPRDCIYAAGIVALKDKAQPMWVENAIKTLVGLVNKRESAWEDCSGYVNCLSGMVDLTRLADDVEKSIIPHDPKYGSRVQVPCEFVPDLDLMDDWIKFWWDVFPGDREAGMPKQEVVQDFFGYCLLPSCRYAKAMFFYGSGANGKSTAMGQLEAMVGRENVSTLTITDLAQRFKTQFLQNKMVNLATETNTRDPMSTEIFKAAVAGDPITAERKYGEPYVFRPFAKWIVAMNDTPVIPDKSFGFERRIIVMNFSRRFEEHEMDPELPEKLRENINGTFFWSLLGLQRLLNNNGFIVPDAVGREKKRFLHALYPLLTYIDERLQLVPGDGDMAVHGPTLFKDYKDWCSESGHRAFSRNKFYEQLLSACPGVVRRPWGDRRLQHFVGIALREEAAA